MALLSPGRIVGKKDKHTSALFLSVEEGGMSVTRTRFPRRRLVNKNKKSLPRGKKWVAERDIGGKGKNLVARSGKNRRLEKVRTRWKWSTA